MPIFGRMMAPPGQPAVPIPDDDRYVSFRTIDGIDIVAWNTEAFVTTDNVEGIDVPPREVVRERSYGLDGSRIVQINTLERDFLLTLWIRPTSRDWREVLDGLAMVRRLADYRTSDYAAHEGTFDVVFHCQGEERLLRVAYLEGLEGDYTNQVGFHEWRVIPLRLLAVNPYLRGQEWTTATVSMPKAAPFLSVPSAPNHYLRIAPSVALGRDMPVTVLGDVPCPPVIELVGAGTSTHITSTAGMDVHVGPVPSGALFVLDSGSADNGRVWSATLNGADADDLILGSPQWGPLPTGATTISVEVQGADDSTRARVYGRAELETAWG